MTAVRNSSTLKTISDVTELVGFIQQHGDRLGGIVIVGRESVQIEHSPVRPQDADVAGSLISWFYLLDDPRVAVLESESAWKNERLAHTTVTGQLNGRTVAVYTAIYGAGCAYLLGLPEVTIHSLRRVQVGDVPEVVAA